MLRFGDPGHSDKNDYTDYEVYDSDDGYFRKVLVKQKEGTGEIDRVRIWYDINEEADITVCSDHTLAELWPGPEKTLEEKIYNTLHNQNRFEALEQKVKSVNWCQMAENPVVFNFFEVGRFKTKQEVEDLNMSTDSDNGNFDIDVLPNSSGTGATPDFPMANADTPSNKTPNFSLSNSSSSAADEAAAMASGKWVLNIEPTASYFDHRLNDVAR